MPQVPYDFEQRVTRGDHISEVPRLHAAHVMEPISGSRPSDPAAAGRGHGRPCDDHVTTMAGNYAATTPPGRRHIAAT